MASDLQICCEYAAVLFTAIVLIMAVSSLVRVLYAEWRYDKDREELKKKMDTTVILRRDSE